MILTLLLQSHIIRDQNDHSGTSGSVFYTFFGETNHLKINGTGAMEDYSSEIEVPWYSYVDSIELITIEHGVEKNRQFFICKLYKFDNYFHP